MGGAPSTSKPAISEKDTQLQKNEKEIVRLMFPVYFIEEEITLEERTLAYDSWHLILDEKSPEFLARKGTPDFHYHSCVTFFYDSFYLRLFDVHPLCRTLFKNGMKSQGKFLVKMISLALSELEDRNKFDKNLIKLAQVHYERGVKAVEYGIVGEVLFWCMKRVLGQATFTPQLQTAWIKVYSRMLKTIVPVAVALELKTNQRAAKSGKPSQAHSVLSIRSEESLGSPRDGNHRSGFEFSTTNGDGCPYGGGSGTGNLNEDDDDHCASEKIRQKANETCPATPTFRHH